MLLVQMFENKMALEKCKLVLYRFGNQIYRIMLHYVKSSISK